MVPKLTFTARFGTSIQVEEKELDVSQTQKAVSNIVSSSKPKDSRYLYAPLQEHINIHFRSEDHESS